MAAGVADRPRRTAKSYSRFVLLMKVILPAAAVGLLGLVVAWPRLTAHDDRFQLGFARINPTAVDTLSMVAPRYFGMDERGQPFSVTAEIATQTEAGTNAVVTLEAPKADMTMSNGSGVVVTADIGYFRQRDNVVDLSGSVDLFHDRGFEVHTTSARINMATGNVSGDEPVRGHGTFGEIEGEGFHLSERGAQVRVFGKSRALLYPNQARKP
ncbi:MAG: LPS export ABC transporter periplasmic protein LptC [Rhodospirillales bacterium]|nr:LPS export ABC transporter periplasmic protein LptC [Rhodospirillales bacterium]